MNIAKPPVQWLFLDLNAFFASCEQQEAPALCGKPIIVVQTLTDSAVAICRQLHGQGFWHQDRHHRVRGAAPLPRRDPGPGQSPAL
jgi:hypothetical protein